MADGISLKFPKVAVALAVYNGVDWLPEQLNSILNQEGVDLSIFISIDPSIDGSKELCQKFAEQYNQVIILPESGRFGGAAQNFFRLMRDINCSDFEYFSFADQDDIWFPSKLKRAVNKLAEKKCDGYSSNVIAFWPTGKKKIVKKSQRQREWDYLFESAGPGCTYLMTSKLAVEIQKIIVNCWSDINKLGLHDWFSYAYARANGFSWYIDDWPSMLYRQHINNQIGVNEGWRALLYRAKKIVGGWGIEQSALIAKLVGKYNSDFVLSWSDFSRYGFFKLALKAHKCRRKTSERFLFFVACLVMVVVGKFIAKGTHKPDEP